MTTHQIFASHFCKLELATFKKVLPLGIGGRNYDPRKDSLASSKLVSLGLGNPTLGLSSFIFQTLH